MSKNKDNKIRDKKINKLLFSFSIILLFFALLIDLNKINRSWLILVEKEYIYYVYAALATVSTISITVLSLITNLLGKKYFGIPIKEIFNSKNGFLKISNFIKLVFLLDLFATLCLAIKYINCVVSLLIIIMLYVLKVSNYLWNLSVNDSKCKNEIELYLVKNDYSNFENTKQKIDYLVEGLSISKNNTALAMLDRNIEFICMIRDNANAQEKIKKYIHDQVNIVFDIISIKHGLFIAIDKVLVLMDPKKESKFKNYDNSDIIYPYIRNVQFVNDSELYHLNLDKLVNGLENINTIEDHEKVFVLYNYFKCLLNNEIISKKVKNSIVINLIENLVQFRGDYKNRYNDVQQKVILNILKYCILLSQDFEQAEFLIKVLSSKLYRGYYCEYEDNKYFYETIALIYFTIYLYSENEVETISQEHRKRIKNMIYLSQDTISNKTISFQFVIDKYFDEILKALWNITKEKFYSLSFLENFENFTESKSVVWNFSSVINFSMCNFFLTYRYKNPVELIDNWENIKDKEVYLRKITDFFEINQSEENILKQNKYDKIKSIAEWINRNPHVLKEIVNNIGEKINNISKKLNKKIHENIDDINFDKVSDKIKNLVNEKLKDSELKEYSNSVKITDNDKQYYFGEIKETKYLQEQYHEIIVNRIYKSLINDSYRKIIKSIEKEKEIEYNTTGIESFIEELKLSEYNKINFDLKGELYYFKNKIKPENWDWIENSPLERIPNKYLNSKVIYKDSLPKFNVKINDYKIENLNDNECEKYSENFKVSNEYYKIDNTYYTKSEAMDLINKNCRKVAVIFAFKIDKPDDFCGMKINFDYTKLKKLL